MDKYNIKLLKNFETKNKKVMKKEIKINRKNGNKVSLDEVDDLYNYISNRYNIPTENIKVVGLNNERFITLKGEAHEALGDNYDDYLQNKPEEVRDNLENFNDVHFFINTNYK
jgi:C-terminal processing protease CtpA/Prc